MPTPLRRVFVAGVAAATLVAGALSAPTANAAVDPNLALELHLDEQRFGAVYDTSQYDNYGTAIYLGDVPGRFGRGMNFVGQSSNYGPSAIRIDDDPSLEPARVTVMAWVKRNGNIPNYASIVGKGSIGCSDHAYGLATYNNANSGSPRFYVRVRPNGGTGTPRVVTTTPVSTAMSNTVWNNSWHALTGTFDGTTVRLYIDGQLASTATPPAGSVIDYDFADGNNAGGNGYGPGVQDLVIGGYGYGDTVNNGATPCDRPSFQYTGDLDEVRIYDRALSASEVTYLTRSDHTTPPELAVPTWRDVGAGVIADSTQSSSLDSVTLATTGSGGSVAWREFRPGGGAGNQYPVVAKSLTGALFAGGAWSALGAQLPSSATGAAPNEISSATIGGKTYIAMTQQVAGTLQVRVYRWDGDAWREPVEGANPINIASSRNGRTPDIIGVRDPATGAEQPYVTWVESNGTAAQVRVKRFVAGAGSAPGVWQEVGAGATPVNVTPSKEGAAPTLADVNGVPYIAYSQVVNASPRTAALRVRRYQASNNSWVDVGAGATPINQFVSGGAPQEDATTPTMQSLAGVPYLVWQERGELWSARWGGSAWESTGRVDPYFDLTPPSGAADPSLAMVNGVPWAAWREKNADGNYRIYAYRFNGAAWVGSFTSVNGDAPASGQSGPPTLRSVNDTPVVAFSETKSPKDAVRVMAYGDPPSNIGKPAMSGTPKVGSPMTCTGGSWTGLPQPTLTILWDRAPRGTTSDSSPAWAAINGATGGTYTLQPTDAGSRVRCRVVAKIPGLGFQEAVTPSKRVDTDAPQNTKPPFIVGGQTDEDTLTCELGEWANGPDFGVQWLRDGEIIAGATGRTYRAAGESQAPTITCRVAASNDVGVGQPATSAGHQVFGAPPFPRVTVRVNVPGGPVLGRVVTCDKGVWQFGVDYTYAWFRNGSPIAGETGPEYRNTTDDLGRSMSCEVTGRNPKGSYVRRSNSELLPLPAGTQGGVMMQAGGRTELDPKNLLAVSSDYLAAVDEVAQKRRTAVVASERTRCAGVAGARDPFDANKPQLAPPTEKSRCQILVQAFDRVVITARTVQYRTPGDARRPGCFVDGEDELIEVPGRGRVPREPCHSLAIDIPPVSSSDPPVQDADFAEIVAPKTPKEVLWDVDGDSRTDAICPGTAPVLRSLLNKGAFNARAIIVAQDSELTGVFSSASAPVYSGGETQRKGTLRSAQPFVCRTGLTPPPDPNLGPCVTDANIGRVRITNANLCPISVRAITLEELRANFPDVNGQPSEDYLILKGIAETLDLEGETAKKPRYVQPPAIVGKATPFANTTKFERDASATAMNYAGAILKSRELDAVPTPWTVEPATAARVSSDKFVNTLRSKVPELKIDKGAFALDQIYLAKGTGLQINGVTITPKDAIPMLIPSDVREAIDKPSYKSMRLLARKADEYLGTNTSGIPLQVEKNVRATLNDAKDKGVALLNDAVDLDELTRKFESLAKKLDLGPFKLSGGGDLKLEQDGTATLTANASFDLIKDALGSPFKTKVTLKGDLQGNVKLQGIEMSVPHGAKLGAIELQDLFVKVNNGVTIKGKILLPPTGEGINIVDFSLDGKGNLTHFEIYYVAGSGTGIAIAPPTPMYLIEVGGGIDKPAGPVTTLIGGAKVSVGPKAGSCAAADVGVKLNIALGGTPKLVARARGDVSVVCLPLGTLDFYLDSAGLISIDGQVKFNAGPLFLDGKIGARMYLPEWQTTIDGTVGLKDLPIVGDVKMGASFALSSKGAAACVSVDLFFDDFSGGLGVKFSDGRPPLSVVEFLANLRPFLGCDLSDFRPLGLSGAIASKSAAAPPGTSFKLPDGGGTTLLSIEGAGSAPRVVLRSPSGKTFDFTHAAPAIREKEFAGEIREQEDRTVVALKNPEGGTWTALPAEGSSQVVRVQAANKLPKPKVKVRARGKGSKRTLQYDVARIDGQRVDFVEQSEKGYRKIGSVKGGGKGTFSYVTSEDASKQRTVVAHVVQNDMPRVSLTVAKYSAPAPTVGKPKVRVKRSSKSATISWSKAATADQYTVVVVGSKSGTNQQTASAKKRKLTVRGLIKGETLRVTVVATSKAGRTAKSKTIVVKDKPAKKKR